jgi:hypothetical protein
LGLLFQTEWKVIIQFCSLNHQPEMVDFQHASELEISNTLGA